MRILCLSVGLSPAAVEPFPRDSTQQCLPVVRRTCLDLPLQLILHRLAPACLAGEPLSVVSPVYSDGRCPADHPRLSLPLYYHAASARLTHVTGVAQCFPCTGLLATWASSGRQLPTVSVLSCSASRQSSAISCCCCSSCMFSIVDSQRFHVISVLIRRTQCNIHLADLAGYCIGLLLSV